MKKILLTIALVSASMVSYAQGTINFNNRVSNPNVSGTFYVDAPVKGLDGVSNLPAGTYVGQLYAGTVGTVEGSLQAVGGTIAFRTASGLGYLNTTGVDTSRTLNNVAPGANAVVQFRVWDTSTGSTWETATIRGQSTLLTIATGGAGSPPSLPANLVGLQSFQIAPVPEPTTIALGLLGAGALLAVRRRK